MAGCELRNYYPLPSGIVLFTRLLKLAPAAVIFKIEMPR
jgi:hypothetical protein